MVFEGLEDSNKVAPAPLPGVVSGPVLTSCRREISNMQNNPSLPCSKVCSRRLSAQCHFLSATSAGIHTCKLRPIGHVKAPPQWGAAGIFLPLPQDFFKHPRSLGARLVVGKAQLRHERKLVSPGAPFSQWGWESVETCLSSLSSRQRIWGHSQGGC